MNRWKLGVILLTCLSLTLLQAACKSSDKADNATETATSTSDESQRILDKEAFGAAIKKSGAIVVDVRMPEEFEQGHIDKAINIDFFDEQFKYNILELNRDKKYYLYCKNENRSYRTMKYMEDNGFKQVFMLKGGYQDWNTAKPIEETK